MMRTRLASALLALLASIGTFALVAPTADAQSTSRAVVIVSTGSGVYRNVIEFSGTITGLDALQLAGASPETIAYGAMGQAVCKLYGVGDAPVPGSCPGGWVYYRAVGGATVVRPTCACDDVSPNGADTTCAQERDWGNCSQQWMTQSWVYGGTDKFGQLFPCGFCRASCQAGC